MCGQLTVIRNVLTAGNGDSDSDGFSDSEENNQSLLVKESGKPLTLWSQGGNGQAAVQASFSGIAQRTSTSGKEVSSHRNSEHSNINASVFV